MPSLRKTAVALYEAGGPSAPGGPAKGHSAPVRVVDYPARPEQPMKLRFLGATTTVTGSQFLLTTDRARVLVDCGLFQGSPAETERNRDALSYDPAGLDAILITHAHLDHCGYLPVVVREGFVGPIFLTPATAELARLVLLDSAKVQREQARGREAEAQARRDGPQAAPRRRRAGRPRDGADGPDREARLRSQPPRIRTRDLEPLYGADDAEAAVDRFRVLDYGEARSVATGARLTFLDAGHILGSAIVVLDVESDAAPARRLVFSGDLGRPGTPIIRDPTPVREGADFVILESTYGGRRHESVEEAAQLLGQAVRDVAARKGVLLIPAFAIGRTQEIVWQLDRLLAAGEIPHLPLYLDSPMASTASDIYRRHAGAYDAETSRLLEAGETPLDYPGARITNEPAQSRALAHAPRPMIILASSGMLTGGRVVQHLRDLIDDPGALLLFVGYQGEGTLGAHLEAGAARAEVDGRAYRVRCEVRSISGFSAHADEAELLAWLAHLAGGVRKPRRVFLVHGDPPALEAMERGVVSLGLAPYRPRWREEVALD